MEEQQISETSKLSGFKRLWKEEPKLFKMIAVIIVLLIIVVLLAIGIIPRISSFINTWKIDEIPLSWNLYSGGFDRLNYNNY